MLQIIIFEVNCVIIAAPFRHRSSQACNHQGAWPDCARSSQSSEPPLAGVMLPLLLPVGFPQFPCTTRRHEWHDSTGREHCQHEPVETPRPARSCPGEPHLLPAPQQQSPFCLEGCDHLSNLPRIW
jgi:hypothetical protein